MNKLLSYNDIGYEAATFKVDDTTKSYLEKNYYDAGTGRVDINGKNLAVALTGDNTVGFGAETPTATNALFGIIIAYEEDGYASVQYKGFVEDVETTGAIALNTRALAVNEKGIVTTVEGANARAIVTKASTEEDKKAIIYIG